MGGGPGLGRNDGKHLSKNQDCQGIESERRTGLCFWLLKRTLSIHYRLQTNRQRWCLLARAREAARSRLPLHSGGFPGDDPPPEHVVYRQVPPPPRDDPDWATRRVPFNHIEAGSVEPVVVVAWGPPLTSAPGGVLPRAHALGLPDQGGRGAGAAQTVAGYQRRPLSRQLPCACERSGQCVWIVSMWCIRRYCFTCANV